ncbi:MAG: glutamyl-tRNA reductase [Acidobacteria bacterium RIFCSPLOWO2_12_FULL_54_10]|nr:MAG: glutamyl-tRNA reductase [Acidobacteria bacterium RIFCSPLOWO2_12_FULL_54_10]
MNFCLVGLSHKTAPVEVREQLAIAEEMLPDALRQATSLPDIAETYILSTCNRVEILALAERDDGGIGPRLGEFLAELKHRSYAELQPYLYEYRQKDAIRHLFRVASSLDSMIIGETQILGQVKAAYNVARTAGTLGGILDEVLCRSFSVAKRVRTETAIATSAVSVSYAAVELAKKIFGSLDGKHILLIGAGKMSELAAKHLLHSGAAGIMVTNRTASRAEEMAASLQGRAIPFDRFLDYAAQCDILISSTAAQEFIISKSQAQRLLADRKNRPIFLVDIAVPRNISPEVNKLDNLFLYDIDDLEGVVQSNLKERTREAQLGEQITDAEVEKLMRRLKTLDVVPTIVDLQAHFEKIRQDEITRLESEFRKMSASQREAVEAMTKHMINKMLHSPVTELKTLAQHPDGLKLVETVRRIFNLKS